MRQNVQLVLVNHATSNSKISVTYNHEGGVLLVLHPQPRLERGRRGECGASDCLYQQCINPLLPASRLPGEPCKHYPGLEAKQSG